ncbi:MAG: thiol-disulfide oxidoreductase DCC family protein [Polyangiales bacterium]
MTALPSRVIFYDGVCAMCNGIVKLLLRIDRRRVFHYAALESETAEAARRLHPEIPDDVETMVYVRDGDVFVRSNGAFEAFRELAYPWKAVSWLRILPTALTDFFYRMLAANRYRFFGKYEVCPLPPQEHRVRFLP